MRHSTEMHGNARINLSEIDGNRFIHVHSFRVVVCSFRAFFVVVVASSACD